MNVAIVTMWYNEEDLAPFFLSHYSYVNKIYVLVDSCTDDNTREICDSFSNVECVDFEFPERLLDDEWRFNYINNFIYKLYYDWVYVLDSDEFIMPKNFEDPKKVLNRQVGNVLYADMYHVYRHTIEKDLDINNKPVILQRRHGSYKSTCHGFEDGAVNRWYRKPCVLRPEVGLRYLRNGVHEFEVNQDVIICEEEFTGAHWAFADEGIAVKRRIRQMQNRQSARNIELKQDIYVGDSEDLVHTVCEMMNNEPLVF